MKYLLFFPLIVLTAFSNPPIVAQKINEYLESDLNNLLEFYKQRHQNPEISLMEKETSKVLAAELRQAGVEVTENIGGFGIVGILKNGAGPTILYRTDMDALPMQEKTGLDYASNIQVEKNGSIVGTMHSCGHDMHMTSLLGTVRAMVAMKDQWKGTLMLIGQPAEEIGAGAKAMLADGLYEKFGVPDFGVGLHCNATMPAGQVGFGKGYTFASSEMIDIKVFGQGAHGAYPHMSIDPVIVASMIIMDLQTIVSRNMNPIESAVVTVGAIHGGTVGNIIPDEVTLKLTVRAYKEEVRLMVHKRIVEITRGIAIAAGLPEDKMPEVIFSHSATPANYNDPKLVDRLIASAGNAIGSGNVVSVDPVMGGEDFSMYGNTSHKVPTVMYWLGTVPEARMKSGDLPGLHSPFYYPEPKTTLETAVKVTTQGLIDLFNQK